ncbi:DUF748 domain-containing protein [Lentisphaera marina]|uniref:DUF748 domain-containing protein n=1 Tax=Lentisphaera marina TaxID=1111041 RepID=UPI0023671CD8|nr:DUF748 domain-containing protein [Lentisphaera marina]MDD7984126.1 DUF748 domain-containing protein [Lentisphaera marina]
MIQKLSACLGQTKKTRRIRITLLACTVFYFIFLGLIAPLIIRSQASKELSNLLQRPVQIEKVSINPFCNSLSIKNFSILEKDNKEFLHWDEFYINFELSSIFTFSWNFKEIALKEPKVNISRLTAKLFNFSDIIDTLNKLPKAEKNDAPTSLPPVSINSLTISNGQILIKDFSRTKEKSLQVPLINLSISNFNTKINKDSNNQYDFRVLTEHDAGLHWQGQVTLSPLQSHGSLKINGAKIKNISDIFADELPFTILSGDIGTEFVYNASLEDQLKLQISEAKFSLEQFNVKYKDESPLIQLNSFEITDASYDLNEQNLIIPLIKVSDTKAYSTLLETGLPKSIRLTELDAFSQALIGEQTNKTSEKTPATETTKLSKSPINFLVKQIQGEDLNLYFTDESTNQKPHAKIEKINFKLNNLSSDNAQNFSINSQFKINETADFELNSEGALFPVHSTGKIQLNNFPLDFSNPYLTRFSLPVTVEQGSLLQIIEYELALNEQFQLTKGKINTEVELIDFSVKDDSTDKALFSDSKLLKAYESVDENSRIHIMGELDILSRSGAGEFHIRSIDLANAAEHFAKELPFKVRSGDFEFMSRAKIQFGDNLQLSTSDGAINLNSLVIQELNDKELINLGNFFIGEIHSSLSEKEVTLGSIELKGLQLNAHLDQDKQLNFIKASDFSKLIQSLEKYQTTPTNTTKPSQETPKIENQKDWQVTIKKIDLDQINLAFLDESINKAAQQTINDIQLKVADLSNRPDHSFESSLNAKLNQHSKFSMISQTSLNPIKVHSKLSLEPLSLKSLQNYLSEFLNAKLHECKISTEAELTYDNDKALLKGNFTSSNFQLNELTNDPLVSFENFIIQGFEIDPLNLTVKVEEIQLNEPKMFIEVDPKAQVNLSTILKEVSNSTPEPKETSSVEQNKSNMKPLIEVKKFTINNAHGEFKDLSISPNFSISLDKFSGTVNNITNNADQESNWFFQGFVDNYAPLKVKGQSRFLASPFALDLNLTLDNLGLTGFSPYTGTFIGYKLQEGQLSLDLDYTLENNELDGKNKVLMSRFELGDSVDSDKAVNLPIKLGVALIRDYNKNIDLDLNIHGDINDPNFSVLNLLWKVFSNIIVKAATSPFSLLANLASSGQEDLNQLQFEAGKFDLNDIEKAKLKTLSTALEKRPSLALNITGYSEFNTDTEQLKNDYLQKRIKVKAALLSNDDPDETNLQTLALATIYEQESGESWKNLKKRLQVKSLQSAAEVQEDLGVTQTQTKTRSRRSRVGVGKFRSIRRTPVKKTVVEANKNNETLQTKKDEDIKSDGNDAEEVSSPEAIPTQSAEEVAFNFLLEKTTLDPNALELLALNRAKAVKEALVSEFNIPSSRVFLVAPKEMKNQKLVELNLDTL